MTLLAGFERTRELVSKGLRPGQKVLRVDQVREVPDGERHAVREGESRSLCGSAEIVITNGEWAEQRGMGFRNCAECKALVDAESRGG